MNLLNRLTSSNFVKPSNVFAIVTVGSGLITGCAVTGDQYAWSHAMSGDYLFAYDQELCADQSVGDTASPEFFSCMQGLGYFLIDPSTGAPVAALNADTGAAPAEQASL